MWTLIFDDRLGLYYWVQIFEFDYDEDYGWCGISEGWSHPEDCWIPWTDPRWMSVEVEGNWN